MSFSVTQLAALVPLTSAIFMAGYQVNRIDELFTKAHASEKEQIENREVLLDIHGRVCSIEVDIKNINSKLDR